MISVDGHTNVARTRTPTNEQIRRGLGDELDRAKRVWVKHALRTGEDSHIHGQWRELKASSLTIVPHGVPRTLPS